jgi:hypothetical protein
MAELSKLREKILAANDIKTELVHIPEWDADILCKTMSARQRAAWIDAASDSTGKLRAVAMYDIVLTNCFDPDTGELLFDKGDRDTLLEKSGAAVGKLQEVIFRLSGLTKDAEEAAGKN